MSVAHRHAKGLHSPEAGARLPSVAPCAHCGLETNLHDPATWFSEALDKNVGANNPVESGPRGLDEPLVFCCHGCMGAYALIHEMGLEAFYSLRDQRASEVAPVHSENRSTVLADLDAAGVPVEHLADGLCRVRLAVDGLHCAACSWLIEKMQPNIPGCRSARVRMSDASLELIYDPQSTSPMKIADRLSQIGYSLSPLESWEEEDQSDAMLRREHWIGMAVAFFLAANSMWIAISLYAGESTGIAPSHERFLRIVGALLGLLAAVFPGRVFFRTAWASMRAGVPHVDIPVALGLSVGTIGSLVGAITGRGHIYFDSLASLVFLLRVGRYIQFRAQYRTGVSLSKLMRMNSVVANRIAPDGTRSSVPSHRLQKDDQVEVLPGQIVPADGVVIEGSTTVQTAFLTGESRPVPLDVGQEVVGGSLNAQSPFRLRVTAAGNDSRIGKLSELVREASSQRTPLIKLADRIGGIFVWVVIGLSIITFIGWTLVSGPGKGVEHTVALLTIACPCALALAAPLVITVTLGRAASEQIWIRDGNCLERLAQPGIVWFDKTGTLTYGDLRVVDWDGPSDLLPRIAALEMHSEHPAARAIRNYAIGNAPQYDLRKFKVDAVEQTFGQGISGLVDGQRFRIGVMDLPKENVDDRSWNNSAPRELSQRVELPGSVCQTIHVWVDGKHLGQFKIGDRLRPEAIRTLAHLQSCGWKLALLSGDQQDAVNQVATLLREGVGQHDIGVRAESGVQEGIDWVECRGGCSPEEKLAFIRESKQRYPTTVMVGDGINDAASLACADVGIAVRGAGENCLRHAPIYIPNHQLDAISRLVDASRKTVQGIHRCFAASLIYNAITISLAISGWIHPLIAAIFMPISGLTVLAMALSAKAFTAQPASSQASLKENGTEVSARNSDPSMTKTRRLATSNNAEIPGGGQR